MLTLHLVILGGAITPLEPELASFPFSPGILQADLTSIFLHHASETIDSPLAFVAVAVLRRSSTT